MPLLKTERYRGKYADFKYKIYVNATGDFTTTLPEDIVAVFKEAKIELHENRSGREGFFTAPTLEELKHKINKTVEECFSMEIISQKIVIHYNIQTTCTYCLNTAGGIVPNGNLEWTGTDDYQWLGGTKTQHATQPQPYGILVCAKPYTKAVFKYKSGKEHVEYERLFNNYIDRDEMPYLYHLAAFCSMAPPNGKEPQEITYTEDTARFFVELLTSICSLNEKIKGKLDPKSILKIAQNKQKLLG